MIGPYRESGRALEQRWSERARDCVVQKPRWSAWTILSWPFRKIAWHVGFFIELVIEVLRLVVRRVWTDRVAKPEWTDFLQPHPRAFDLPRLTGPLDGLTHPDYDFRPREVEGCELEMVPFHSADLARVLMFWRYMRECDAMLRRHWIARYGPAGNEVLDRPEPTVAAQMADIAEQRAQVLIERYSRPLRLIHPLLLTGEV